MLTELSAMFTRELATLVRELEAYPDDASVWRLVPGIRNSTGTLTLHLCGNLQHFIGAQLGSTGYVRQREIEFSSRDTPRETLIAEVSVTRETIPPVLAALSPDTLDAWYPSAFGPLRVRTRDFLMHLGVHLAFHVGQVDYHRRVLLGDDRSVSPIAIPELATATAISTSSPGT